MAFATVTIEDKKNNIIKEAPVGFSWTVLFFGGFVPLVRGDWGWFFIMLIAGIVTFGISGIIFAFIYNRTYLQNSLTNFISSMLRSRSRKAGRTTQLMRPFELAQASAINRL